MSGVHFRLINKSTDPERFTIFSLCKQGTLNCKHVVLFGVMRQFHVLLLSDI